jgi:glycosyltransferase involved in cell wall biosynthesis
MSPRVLHVTTVHPPFDGRIFGMEARSLAAAGFDVSLATTVAAEGERDGIRLVPLGEIRNASRRSERLNRNLRALRCMRGTYDIVHIHDPELLVAAGIAQTVFGRAIVYDVHEYYDEKFGGGDVTAAWIPKPLLGAVRNAYRLAERAVLPRAAGIVVVHEAMLERYRRLLPPDRIAVVQNFPNFAQEELDAARRAERPLRDPYVVHTGGASRDRIFDVVVAAAERLRGLGQTAQIVNLGPIRLEGYPPAERRALLRRAEAAGILMPGNVSQSEALRWIAHARIGYLPLWDSENNRRGQPRKLFEYLLMGLPVVASAVGNVAKIVRRYGVGRAVAASDAAAHAEALALVLSDEELHARYASRARAVAPAFSFGTQSPNLIRLYERILSSQDKAARRRNGRGRLGAARREAPTFQDHAPANLDGVVIREGELGTRMR